MEYYFLGLCNQLEMIFATRNLEDSFIDLILNVDGVPLFKSSGSTLWPVLGAIANISPPHVFPIALTYGHSKPENLDFLSDTISELSDLLENGIHIDDNNVTVTLKGIICDAPARAFIKLSKQYSGYYGCDKCSQKGEWVGRMTYPIAKEFEKRTDGSFRDKANEEHHHGTSPFCDLPIDMVKCFPVDYMHQACLGVMRKLLLIWIRGKGRLLDVRMSAAHVARVSEKLVAMKCSVPSEFQRKPRSLTEIDRWKATELRQCLLYTGKLCFEGILRKDLYDHFMALSVATCILACPSHASKYSEYASELMIYFNEQGRVLYGPEFLVYNVHSMVHLADEAAEFGNLDACSAFAFENYLQRLKRLVRSGKQPLIQIASRLSERCGMQVSNHDAGVVSVSVSKPNNCYILSDTS
ncbi:hypothetical protein HOLleu_26594 [Holothuria leucospilota]|uniref:Transposase domain-containing protein n=1 Tax=Holothuria leucospilota TaxID=206669 RepID=A0A9Q1H1N9_HOLLE|nr:hypothetical protein HOLleu_26594 [Holothuria leucospilota]